MRFTDYGAFVDLGGIDGLLHISEISWGKLKHPQEVLQIGDTVKVKILSMNEEKRQDFIGPETDNSRTMVCHRRKVRSWTGSKRKSRSDQGIRCIRRT